MTTHDAEPVPEVGAGHLAHRAPRWRTAVVTAIGLVVVVVGAGVLWVFHESSSSGPPGRQVIVTVRPGTGTGQFAAMLVSDRIIGSALAYRIWNLVDGVTIQPGRYALRRNSSFGAVDGIVGNGPNVFSLVVPPGFTVSELARRVGQLPGHDAGHFATVAASGTVRSQFGPAGSHDLEGLLAPGTYTVMPGETDAQLLTQMVDRFDTTADALGLVAGAGRLGLTPYQVVIAASIVEKEGVIQQNLGPVARVILNRLADNMPLQMNATVLYAEGRDGGAFTSSDLTLQSPYNSYLNKGLTPTPISFPSEAALAATINPPPGSWLYFVVVAADGTEAFSATYAGQLANEALAARRGVP
ncbi:MAG: endolytic transglycosylase MltG [Acidimicrobiales bacterium]